MTDFYCRSRRVGRTAEQAARVTTLRWAKRRDFHARVAKSGELTEPLWWWVRPVEPRRYTTLEQIITCGPVNAKGQTAFAAWQASSLRDLPFAAVRCFLFD